MEQVELEFLKKYDSGEKFTEAELYSMHLNFEEIETTYEGKRRWSRRATTIFKIGNRCFCLKWDQGLTEMQEDEYYEQPYEVYPVKHTKLCETTSWEKPINKLELATVKDNSSGLIIKKKEDDGNFILNSSINRQIVDLELIAKQIKTIQEDIRAEILKEMEANNIIKLETNELTVSYIAETYKETFDSKTLKAENEELYNKYVKISPVKSSVRIKVK